MFWRHIMLCRLALCLGLVLAAGGPVANGQCELCERFADDDDAEPGDLFGSHVAIDGDYAVVGAPGDDDASPTNPNCNSGSAYVFCRDAMCWTLVAKFTASDAACGDAFGHDVAISGDWVFVGASGDDNVGGSNAGAVYVFKRPLDGWEDMTETQKLTADDGEPNDQFGFVADVSGNWAAVGAVLEDTAGTNAGAAYVFRNDNNIWVERTKLTASDPDAGDQFGVSVAIDGDYILVGADWNDYPHSKSGSAYVFARDDNGTPSDLSDDLWPQEARLTASDSASGDEFGGHSRGVDIDGEYAVVGARKHDHQGPESGAAYVFVRTNGIWSEVDELLASDGQPGDRFGQAVAIAGDCIVVGTFDYPDPGPDTGAFYLFCRDDSGTPANPLDDSWLEILTRAKPTDAAPYDEFAVSVAMSGPYGVFGADRHDHAAADAGSVYFYQLTGLPDCNSNGIADECDILGGTSFDANTNGVPDECEPGLDIKPGSCPNPLNRGSHGVLPVALLGTDEFDAMTIDVSSVRLGRADGVGGLVAPHEGPPGPHSVFEDVATPFEGEVCECHDLSGDGVVDLLVKFKTDDVVAALLLDDLPAGALVQLVVSGYLLDGTPFEGSDCIRLVPPGAAGALLAVESSVAGAWIGVDPLDETLDGGGFADFQRGFPLTTVVTLTAEEWAGGRPLRGWQIGGLLHHMGQTSIEFAIDQDMTVSAVYGPTPSGGSPKPPGEMTPDEMAPDEMVAEPIQGESAEPGTIDRR